MTTPNELAERIEREATERFPIPFNSAYSEAEHVANKNSSAEKRAFQAGAEFVAALRSPAGQREGLSDAQKHNIAHARYMVDRASPEKPEICFDYTLVASLLAIIDRLSARAGGKALASDGQAQAETG